MNDAEQRKMTRWQAIIVRILTSWVFLLVLFMGPLNLLFTFIVSWTIYTTNFDESTVELPYPFKALVKDAEGLHAEIIEGFPIQEVPNLYVPSNLTDVFWRGTEEIDKAFYEVLVRTSSGVVLQTSQYGDDYKFESIYYTDGKTIVPIKHNEFSKRCTMVAFLPSFLVLIFLNILGHWLKKKWKAGT